MQIDTTQKKVKRQVRNLKPDVAIQQASDDTIKQLFTQNLLAHLSINKIRELLGGKYTNERVKNLDKSSIQRIKSHLLTNLDSQEEQKAINFIKQSDIRAQMMEQLDFSLRGDDERKNVTEQSKKAQTVVQKYMDRNNINKDNISARNLAELRHLFGIEEEEQSLTKKQFQERYESGRLFQTLEDLQRFRDSVENIQTDKILAQVSNIMQEVEKENKKDMFALKSESESDTDPMQRFNELRLKWPSVIDRVSQIQGRSMGLMNDGEISDSSGMRSVPGPGIIEESKIAQKAERLKIPRPKKKQADDEALAQIKLAQKEVVRNGGQNGADLAVVENDIGIETYMETYPTLDEMLNLSTTRQLEFDLAQRKHLTTDQTALMQEILSTGMLYKPNIEFLRDEYKNAPTEANLEKYNNEIIKQMGKQVAYYGGSPVVDKITGKVTSTQTMAKIKEAKPGEYGSKNVQDQIIVNKKPVKATLNDAVAGLNKGLTKPEMMDVSEITKGIAMIVDYISKLSGNLNTPDLKSYKVENVFSGSVVRKEPTTFKPMAGQGFKVRSLEC